MRLPLCRLSRSGVLAYDDSVDLDDFTTIEDTAAESLSKHERSLELNSLAEFSDAAAESLSRHDLYLDLSGLTELSDAAAIAWKLGRKLKFNPDTEEFVGDEKANKMRSRAMREPWTV